MTGMGGRRPKQLLDCNRPALRRQAHRPWSEPRTLVTSSDHPGLYGGFIYPWARSGDDLYFVMSRWGPYNTYLMHTRLTAV